MNPARNGVPLELLQKDRAKRNIDSFLPSQPQSPHRRSLDPVTEIARKPLAPTAHVRAATRLQPAKQAYDPRVRLLMAVFLGVGLVVLEMIGMVLAAAFGGSFGIAVSALVLAALAVTLSRRRGRRRIS